MWICCQCEAKNDERFLECWSCELIRGKVARLPAAEAFPNLPLPEIFVDGGGRSEVFLETPRERGAFSVAYAMFRGNLQTWSSLFNEAAGFATELGRERVISISHAEDQSDAVITVWYWE